MIGLQKIVLSKWFVPLVLGAKITTGLTRNALSESFAKMVLSVAIVTGKSIIFSQEETVCKTM
jgi:hypothetical protein